MLNRTKDLHIKQNLLNRKKVFFEINNPDLDIKVQNYQIVHKLFYINENFILMKINSAVTIKQKSLHANQNKLYSVIFFV